MKALSDKEKSHFFKIYQEGERASVKRLDRNTNPYEPASHESVCWLAGFNDQETVARRRAL